MLLQVKRYYNYTRLACIVSRYPFSVLQIYILVDENNFVIIIANSPTVCAHAIDPFIILG